MLRKLRLAGALLVLTALLVLSVRPIAVQALGIRPDPQDIKIVGKPGGGHCYIMSTCDTVTPNTVGMDAVNIEMPLLFSFAIFTVALGVQRIASGVRLTTLNPPPRYVLG